LASATAHCGCWASQRWASALATSNGVRVNSTWPRRRPARRKEPLLDQQHHETERVEARLAKVRDELVRTSRLAAIGQVAASIAHDLRNPLGAAGNACYF